MAIRKSDLYSSLWQSCDELRGGMDASQYKDYVLFMLFIKYVSDKYGNSDDFAPPVTIPDGASFADMLELRGRSDVGDRINTQVIAPLVQANTRLAHSDFPDFNDPNKLGEGNEMVERLTNLINITSYEPNHNAISREPAQGDERYKFDTYTAFVLGRRQTTKQYEDEAKRRFIEEPAQMKLLIVVSKLLTGFDAPSCTYIYLDNELRDHNLFQAICRTNRLDGEDKEYGHIVDFKQLFSEVEEAISVYSSDELDTDQGGRDDNNVHLKDWLSEGRDRLDGAPEALRYLCDPVPPPRELEQYLHYFCGDAFDPDALGKTEPLRISFYKAVADYVRAFAALAQDLVPAGYSATEATVVRDDVRFYGELRSSIKKLSGEELDVRPYEADMRHLLNMYVHADDPTGLGELSELTLTESIIKTGIHDAVARKLNEGGTLSRNAIAEGIINNVRKTIIRDQLTDPRFYEQMSKLLDDLITQSREDAAAYEAFLRNAEALVKRLSAKQSVDGVPTALHGRSEATVIYNNLPQILAAGHARVDEVTESPPPEHEDERVRLALEIDRVMREHAPAGWKGDQAREAQVLNALFPLLDRNRAATLALFELVKNQPGY